ncbi:hypothetical protein B188_11010 [Candidatus Brocadiaceae bacterium B188]|nr:hypothetical protein [Candidatus Brocadia sapporoensis]QQR66195.1 MAG: hypothetical protein IPI25_11800 [Candidatus Brocadia sp.]TWU53137.1 hypothetical protein B188_11010 [Candidatus Brocadiaceae bacterium B188]
MAGCGSQLNRSQSVLQLSEVIIKNRSALSPFAIEAFQEMLEAGARVPENKKRKEDVVPENELAGTT